MKFYTVTDIAKMFHHSEGAIRAWLRSGYLLGTKTKRTWLISDQQLATFLSKIGA